MRDGDNVGVWPCFDEDFERLSKMSYSKSIIALSNGYNEEGVFSEYLYKQASTKFDKDLQAKKGKRCAVAKTKSKPLLSVKSYSQSLSTQKYEKKSSSSSFNSYSSKQPSANSSLSSTLIETGTENQFWLLTSIEKINTMRELSNLSEDFDATIYFRRGQGTRNGNISSEMMKNDFKPGKFTHGSILDAFLLAWKSKYENNEYVRDCTVLDHSILTNIEQNHIVSDQQVETLTNNFTEFMFTEGELIGFYSYPFHWVILIISSKTGHVQLLDLLHKDSATRDNITLKKVILWHKSMRNKMSTIHSINPPLPELTYSTTRARQLRNIGTQKDGYSCGIIASALACYWMIHRSIPECPTFSANTEACEDFRIYMAHTIFGEKNKVPQDFTLDPAQVASIPIDQINYQQAMLENWAEQQALALKNKKSK